MNKFFSIFAVLLLVGCSSTATMTNSDIDSQGDVITATGSGNSFEEAKDAALRNAVQIGVGSFHLSQREVRNNVLVKDNIVDHSSGHVTHFTVIDSFQVREIYKIKHYVTVKARIIASGIGQSAYAASSSVEVPLNVLKENPNIHFQLMQKQEEDRQTLQRNADNRDENYLTGYFQNNKLSLIVHKDKTVVRSFVNNDRSLTLNIDYVIGFDKSQISSMNEAMSLIGTKRDGSLMKAVITGYNRPGKMIAFESHDLHHFYNDSVFNIVRSSVGGFFRTNYVKISFITAYGKTLRSQCVPMKGFYQNNGNHVYVDYNRDSYKDMWLGTHADRLSIKVMDKTTFHGNEQLTIRDMSEIDEIVKHVSGLRVEYPRPADCRNILPQFQ